MSRSSVTTERFTVRCGADTRRVLRTGVTTPGVEGAAIGRSPVVPLTGTNCPLWTSAGFWFNVSICAAFAPTAYIATPEISAPATPAAIGFISSSLVSGPCGLLQGEAPSAVPDHPVHISLDVQSVYVLSG